MLDKAIYLINILWNYSIIIISNNEVKISNIIIAILILLISIKFSRLFLSFISKLLKANLKNNSHTIIIFEKLILYLTYIFITIIVLQVANIPLSIFAFIGGAFAIGFGLGIQGFMNNLISSIIILLEGAVQIDDLIQVTNVSGRVKSINIRSIILTTNSNSQEIVIPSSVIIQSKVIKWPVKKASAHYHLLIEIMKTDNEKINHTKIISLLKKSAHKLNFIINPENLNIFLTKIGQNSDQLFFSFLYDITLVNNIEKIKNDINFMLLNCLPNKFFVIYG